MRLLVTGGYGFIGSAFVRLALGRGHELVVVDKMTYAADVDNLSQKVTSAIHSENIDISDGLKLERFLDSQPSFDYVVNFAAESHVDRSIKNGLPFVHSNVTGVVNFLEYLKVNPKIKFLQVSTDEVYGSIDEGSWKENFPLNPRSAYSSSKASAEFFCNAYRNTHNLDITITRSANNFGPKQSAEKLIPTVIRSVLNNKKVPIYGNGQNLREWVYVDDHATAILNIIESVSLKDSIYNLGGKELSNNQIVEQILIILGKDITEIEYVDDRKGHDLRYSVDDSRYVTQFGPISNQDFMDQLKFTVDWYLSNDKWLERSIARLSN